MTPVTMPQTALDPTPPSDGPLTEIHGGNVVELPPKGGYPVALAMKIGVKLDVFAEANDLGRAINEILFRIDDEASFRPDVAYISYQTWPHKFRIPGKEPWAVVPDLVVEVVSEHDKAWAVLNKTHRYLQGGTKLVWLVYPNEEVIHVFESVTSIRVFTRKDELDGGSMLPGFRLSLERLFEGEEPPEDWRP